MVSIVLRRVTLASVVVGQRVMVSTRIRLMIMDGSGLDLIQR